jgi:tetratricopeptide (TPR) repeat protein
MIYNLTGRLRTGFFFLLPFILLCTVLPAQVTGYAELAEKARIEFINGRYGEALVYYRELKSLFLQNPEYQYYIGRCLLKLEQYHEETIDNLRFAAIKGDKYDAWFFLGKAYHMNGEYEKAVYAYKRFRAYGKKSDIRQLRVKELQDMAENEGHLSSGRVSCIEKKDNTSSGKTEITEMIDIMEETSSRESAAVNDTRKEAEITNDIKRISAENNHKTVDAFSSEEVNKDMHVQNDANLTKAMELQLIADSLNRSAKMKRAELKETEPPGKRKELIDAISSLEEESRKIQKEADALFRSMQKTLPAEPEISLYTDDFNDPVTIRDMIDDSTNDRIIELKEEINGIKVYQYKTGLTVDENPVDSQESAAPDYKGKIEGATIPAGDVLYFPETCIYNENNPFPARCQYPERLVYHVQLGVLSKKASHDAFGALAPICYEEIADRGVFKYYAGLFFSYKAADEALVILRSRGYHDSFIVSFYKGRQIPLDKARQIEYAQIKF